MTRPPITTGNAAGHAVETFTIRAPEDLVAVTHDGSNVIDPRPAAIDAASNPLLGRMRMNTDRAILLPARGTIFATQIEDAGAVGRTILPRVIVGRSGIARRRAAYASGGAAWTRS